MLSMADLQQAGGGYEGELLARLKRLPWITFEDASRQANISAALVQLCREKVSGQITPLSLVVEDDLCALALYTKMDGDPNNFYSVANRIMRQQTLGTTLNAILPMVRLMLCAMVKLDKFSGSVWRGIKLDLSGEYENGQEITWWSFSSTTYHMEMLEQPDFLGASGPRTLFQISTNCGTLLEPYSFAPWQKEVLLPPGLRFRISGKMTLDNQDGHILTIVQMQQVNSPDSCLQLDILPAPARLPPPPPVPLLVLDVSRRVGAPPTDRTWREEWAAIWSEDQSNQVHAWHTDIVDQAASSLEHNIARKQDSIDWKIANGWAREDAICFSVLVSFGIQPIARALGELSSEYAAATHAICGICVRRSLRQNTIAPACFRNLTGEWGLAEQFPEWRILTKAAARADAGDVDADLRMRGDSFVALGLATFYTDTENLFTDPSGFNVPNDYKLSLSDVVQLVSTPTTADGIMHAPIGSNPVSYRTPPMTTITVEDVKRPGEWEFNGIKMQRRLFVVKMAFSGASAKQHL